MKYSLILIALLTTCFQRLNAQDILQKPNRYSIGYNAGGRIYWTQISAPAPEPAAIYGQLFAQLENEKGFLKLSFSDIQEWALFPSYDPSEECAEFSIIAGRSYRQEKLFAFIGAGPSLNHIMYRDKYIGGSTGSFLFGYSKYSTGIKNKFALVVETTGGISLNKLKRRGISRLSVTIHANISTYSFVTWSIGLSFGRRIAQKH